MFLTSFISFQNRPEGYPPKKSIFCFYKTNTEYSGLKKLRKIGFSVFTPFFKQGLYEKHFIGCFYGLRFFRLNFSLSFIRGNKLQPKFKISGEMVEVGKQTIICSM